MPVELQRTLFIGLGGAGIKTILKTKSMFLERFGEVPPCVGFLGIDTDAMQHLWSAQECGVSLETHEIVTIGVHSADKLYHANQAAFSWMSNKNTNVLSYLRDFGTGSLRSSGRFIFENNYLKIISSVQNAFDRINTPIIVDTEKWALINVNVSPQVHVAFSLCGGTGSGIFINMGYLLREVLGMNVDLQAYAIGPGAFVGCGEYACANAYAAMLDMDYIMTNVNLDHPLEIQRIDGTKSYVCKPYDFFYLIDNAKVSLYQVCSFLAASLYQLSYRFGDRIVAYLSCLKANMADGAWDIGDKKGWVLGHGLCEIKIDRKKLQKTFVLKAAMNLVGDILGVTNTKVKVGEEANGWILSNNRCEHNCDQLLDSLYDFLTIPQSVIASSKSAEARLESDTWVKSEEDKAVEKVHSSYSNRLDEIQKAVDDKIKDVISMYGLNGAKTFVESLQSSFATYEEEMKNELESLKSAQSLLIADRDNVIESWRKTIFGGAGEYRPKLQAAQYELLKNKVDIMRHTKAQQFYLVLKEKLSSLDSKLNASIVMFSNVREEFNKMMTTLNASKDVNPFVIDLSGNIPVTGDHPNNTVSAFIKSNPNLLEMASLSADEVANKFIDFTSSLDGADFSSVSIEDQILNLSADETSELFKEAMRKAAILLDIKSNGKRVKGSTDVYVSLPSGPSSRLTIVPEIEQTIMSFAQTVNSPAYVASSLNSSILIYLISGGYPVFQVETIVKYKEAYEDMLANKCLSFDMALEKKILDEHFGFDPNQRRDDDVLEMWVKGLIFGLIKKDGYRYFVQSRSVSDYNAVNDYWAELDCGSEKMLPYQSRYHAFNDFKSKKQELHSRGDLMEEVRKIEAAKGRDEVKRIYSEICSYSFDEYIKKCSQVGLEPRTIIMSPPYEKIKMVMTDELWYVRERLLDSVK